MDLKIATYNIHKGVSAFGRKTRIHGLKDAINLLNADLVFLQEVQGQHILNEKKHETWPKIGQHAFIAGEDLHHVYGVNATYNHGHHGNALLSRFPIDSSYNHNVSDHEFEKRGNLHAVVSREGVQIHCFVIHLGLFASSRRRQIQALIAYIQQNLPKDAPLIIAGDFNDWSQRLSPFLNKELSVLEAFHANHQSINPFSPSKIFKNSIQNSIQNSFKEEPFEKSLALPHKTGYARTFPAGMPWLCLDRVYTRGFVVKQTKVLSGAPWSSLSDHVPITVDLELNIAS